MAVAAVKGIRVSSDDKTGESEVGANSNINALLTCLLFEFCETLLDFSEQDFILETVMRSYSRRVDFFELIASENKVDYSFHIITIKNNLELPSIK